MKILFTCGGTAGHINPAIALARLFQARHQDCQVLFAGADNGMERTLVPHEGYELRTVHVNTIHRAWKWKDIKHNIMTVVTLPQARRQALGLDGGRPLVLSYWGSLGADVMNRYMADFLSAEAAEGFPFHHIHGAGRNYQSLTAALEERGVDLTGGAEVRAYIYDMPLVMAAADLVVCRAGASTISELTAIAKPCVLVPSPNVTNNHQEKNARVLEHHGAAVVVLEGETDGAALYRQVKDLLADPEKRSAMAKALEELSVTDAAEEIYQTLMALLKEGR